MCVCIYTHTHIHILIFFSVIVYHRILSIVLYMPANAGDIRNVGLISVLGRSPGDRNGNPLQYSCLENSKDRGAWQATVHGAIKDQTRL